MHAIETVCDYTAQREVKSLALRPDPRHMRMCTRASGAARAPALAAQPPAVETPAARVVQAERLAELRREHHAQRSGQVQHTAATSAPIVGRLFGRGRGGLAPPTACTRRAHGASMLCGHGCGRSAACCCSKSCATTAHASVHRGHERVWHARERLRAVKYVMNLGYEGCSAMVCERATHSVLPRSAPD